MGKASRDKGKRGEREVMRLLNEAFAHLGYVFRRGWQSRGAIRPDVYAEELPVHFEVKIGKRPNLKKAVEQAICDARSGWVPVAVARWDGEREWYATMRFDDLVDLLVELEERGRL